jgi:hypothetical protein
MSNAKPPTLASSGITSAELFLVAATGIDAVSHLKHRAVKAMRSGEQGRAKESVEFFKAVALPAELATLAAGGVGQAGCQIIVHTLNDALVEFYKAKYDRAFADYDGRTEEKPKQVYYGPLKGVKPLMPNNFSDIKKHLSGTWGVELGKMPELLASIKQWRKDRTAPGPGDGAAAASQPRRPVTLANFFSTSASAAASGSNGRRS